MRGLPDGPFFFLLFACCGCVNWTLVQSKTHRTMTARCAPPCTQCVFFNACVVKNMIAPCSTALRTLSFPKIVVIQKVRKSTKNVAKARPRNSTQDHNRFHKIVGEVHPQPAALVEESTVRDGTLLVCGVMVSQLAVSLTKSGIQEQCFSTADSFKGLAFQYACHSNCSSIPASLRREAISTKRRLTASPRCTTVSLTDRVIAACS